MINYSSSTCLIMLCAAVGQPAKDSPIAEQVQYWVERLGDPSFEVRSQATRELCKLGSAALEPLRRAAKSDDFEAAFRAQHLLDALDGLYFSGVEVSLQCSRNTTAWDEPLDVVLTFRNTSGTAAKIPMERPTDGPVSSADTVRQVAALIDVGDYLRVLDPAGNEIALHVDDIREDSNVTALVEGRIENAPEMELPPGAVQAMTLPNFNRGWARYPLLKEGTYTIQFVYSPAWDDEELLRAGAGRVESPAVSIKVTKAAPVEVEGSDSFPGVRMDVEGDAAVARLTNRADQPIWINTNWGADQPPFAALMWSVSAGDTWARMPFPNAVSQTLADFDRAKVVAVAPGQTIELVRLTRQQFVALAAEQKVSLERGVRLRVEYLNRTDVSWQRGQKPALLGNEKAPPVLREPLPRRMVFGRVVSEERAWPE